MKDFCILINRDLFKKLRRSFLLTALVVLGVNMAQAQALEGLSGTGTKNDPYIIESKTNWNKFAGYVNSGNSFKDKFVELRDNITVNIENTTVDTIAGYWKKDTDYKAFSGTFNGNGYTLTFNVGKTATYDQNKDQPRAPFGAIKGATIKNLTVNGTIKSKYKYNAGFVGMIFGTDNHFDTCTSSIIIDCSEIKYGSGNSSDYKQWDCSTAGFACENKNGATTYFENCIFDGKIEKKTNFNANRGAGFVSYNASNAGTFIDYTHCLMMGLVDLNAGLESQLRFSINFFKKRYCILL